MAPIGVGAAELVPYRVVSDMAPIGVGMVASPQSIQPDQVVQVIRRDRHNPDILPIPSSKNPSDPDNRHRSTLCVDLGPSQSE
jgi:hypothetical protein